jgi:hypothetical protein
MTPATTGGLQGRPSLSWVYHSTNANVFELLCVDGQMRFRFSREVELQQPGQPVQSVRPLSQGSASGVTLGQNPAPLRG